MMPRIYKPGKKRFCDSTIRKGYLCHHINLKYWVRLGMDVTNLKRVIRFKQKPWMKIFIDKNTDSRAKSNGDF